MRIAIIGQGDFGRAVLNACHERGDEIAGVFVAPDKPGAKMDPLKAAAQEKDLPLFQFASYRKPEAHQALRDLKVDLALMAYVLLFAPQEFVTIPRLGTIQYHPSLLPCYRGPSSINWPIIHGETVTGLTIFRPTDGLDEGPVILQRECAIGPDDTMGSIYFERLFPMGVSAMLEAADLVFAGKHSETAQDEANASYQGWCRAPEARIDWHRPADHVYNLIRGCNPVPGAWTTLNGKKLQIFDAHLVNFRRYAEVRGKIGEVSEVGNRSFFVTSQGGAIEVLKGRYIDGEKLSGADLAAASEIKPGTLLGN